jgi:hypothetical protein
MRAFLHFRNGRLRIAAVRYRDAIGSLCTSRPPSRWRALWTSLGTLLPHL